MNVDPTRTLTGLDASTGRATEFRGGVELSTNCDVLCDTIESPLPCPAVATVSDVPVPKPRTLEQELEAEPVSIKSLRYANRLLLFDFILVGVAGRADAGVGNGSLSRISDEGEAGIGIVRGAVGHGRAGERAGIGGGDEIAGGDVVGKSSTATAEHILEVVDSEAVVAWGMSVAVEGVSSLPPTDVREIASVTGTA